MSKNKDKKIKCDVDSCTHNDKDTKCCELDSISVSCTCNNDECEDCKETICESFETTGSNITDNEYEVNSEEIDDEEMDDIDSEDEEFDEDNEEESEESID